MKHNDCTIVLQMIIQMTLVSTCKAVRKHDTSCPTFPVLSKGYRYNPLILCFVTKVKCLLASLPQ